MEIKMDLTMEAIMVILMDTIKERVMLIKMDTTMENSTVILTVSITVLTIVFQVVITKEIIMVISMDLMRV